MSAPAFAVISPTTTLSPFPGSASLSGTGALTAELVTWTGTGDGTTNPVTFAKVPRVLIIIQPPAVGQNWVVIFSNGSEIDAFTAGVVAKRASSSTAMSTASVDINAVNSALGLTGSDDINKASTTYYAIALEAN